MRVGDVLRDLDSRVLPPLARALHRLGADPRRVRLLTSVALVCTFAVLVTAVWVADRGGRTDPAAPDLLRVGALEGQSVRGYVGASDAEFAALAADPAPQTVQAPVYALVTLVTYFAPDRLPPIVGAVPVAEVYTRAPLPGLQSQVVRMTVARVPQDVVAGMLDTARRRDQEYADYRQLRDALPGRDPAELRLRAAYDQAARVAAAEATAYRAICSCVYGAVVRTTPAGLARLAARPEVRAVDPAPEVRDLGRTEFRPPLPEQVVVDGPGLTAEQPTPRPSTESSRVAPPPTGTAEPAGSPPAAPVPSPDAAETTSVTPSSSSGVQEPAATGVPSSEPSHPDGTAIP